MNAVVHEKENRPIKSLHQLHRHPLTPFVVRSLPANPDREPWSSASCGVRPGATQDPANRSNGEPFAELLNNTSRTAPTSEQHHVRKASGSSPEPGQANPSIRTPSWTSSEASDLNCSAHETPPRTNTWPSHRRHWSLTHSATATRSRSSTPTQQEKGGQDMWDLRTEP